jgi:internalin A
VQLHISEDVRFKVTISATSLLQRIHSLIILCLPRNNSIIYLPRNINNLKRMQDLKATGNPNLAGPPQWVAAQGMPGIHRFYDLLSQAEVTLSLEICNQVSCTVVPPECFHITSLTALTISKCPIDYLQEEVGMILCLTALEISHCNLKRLPSMLSKCLNILSINLQGNELSSLPMRWAELTNMNSLSLAQNRFELVPACIQYFVSLSWFDMCDNLLASIPSW